MKEIKTSWILCCGFIGIILGTLFANGMERMEPGILTVFAIDQYTTTDWQLQERRDFSWYLIRQRGSQFLLFLVIGFICNEIVLGFLFSFFSGFLWGMFLSLETMRIGIQGLYMAIGCFLPQGICYLLAVWLFLKGKEQIRQSTQNRTKKWLLCIVVPVLITCVGILMEMWISPELLQWISQT